MKVYVNIILFLCFCIPLSAQHITGYVYLDDDGNGILEGLEGGLSGVRVLLYKDNGDGVFNSGTDALVATQFSDIQGIYNFDLRLCETFAPMDGNDDAEEDDEGDMSRSSSDLELMEDGSVQNAVGIRFRNVSLNQGETISAAYITFTANESDSETTNLLFRGEDIDDSPNFSSTDNDITDRTVTTASASWTDVPAWTTGVTYDTPDLTSIIQEIVDRGGWASGNDLSIIITGTGKRVAESYNGDSDAAAQLTIKTLDASAVGTYFITINSDDLLPGGTFTEPDASGVLTTTITSASDSLTFQNIGYVGEAITCFLIPESEDRLEIINRVSGNYRVVGQLNSTNNNVEAVSLDLNNNVLYAMDADELGVINLQTGEFISRGNTLGNGDGASGNITFDDVDALSYDFNDDVLYGVQAESGRKLIIIDPLTGELVEDAFGTGVDYLDITGTNLLDEISDLTFAPSSGELYGINTSGSQSQVIQINKATAVATVVANITFDGDNLEDIEALAFTIYNTDTIYVTTGTQGGGTSDSFYSVDLSTGVATDVTASNALSGNDYESCDCFFKAIPSLIEYDPLPLNLIEFSGKTHELYNELSWLTTSEINTSHFEIYRSTTGKNFQEIGRLDTKGNGIGGLNKYAWVDKNAEGTLTYYKLKIVDVDGRYEWSRIIALQVSESKEATLRLSLYPNPAKDQANILIENTSFLTKGTMSLYSLNGQLIKHAEVNFAVRSESIINTTGLQNGIYVIQVNINGKVMTERLYVSH